MKQSENLAEKFISVVKGRNFVTTKVLDYIKIKDGVVELSTGDKIFELTPFGITVVKDNKHNLDLGKCFYSLEDAMNYVDELKK